MKSYNKTYILMSILLLFVIKNANAQVEFQGSQYLLDKTYINPAFMGIESKVSANIQHQSSGAGEVSGAKNYTISAAAHYSLPKHRNAIGFNLVSNTFGNDSYSVGYGNYVYHLPLSEDVTMSSAIGLGLQQYNIDLSGLVTAEGFDPLAKQNIYSSKLDGRFGLLWTYKKNYYFGASFDNILSLYTNNNSFSYQVPSTFRKVNMYMIMGGNIETVDNISVMPSLLYTKNFGGVTSLEINTSLLFEKAFAIGFSFRNRIEEENTFVQENGSGISQSILRATMAYHVKKANNNFKIGYCYNFNAGKNGAKVGSHDISLAYSIPNVK